MKDVFWKSFELAVNAFECFVILEFLTKFFGSKSKGCKQNIGFTAAFIVAFLELSYINHLFVFEGLIIFIAIFIYFLYGVAFLKGKRIAQFFMSVTVMALIIFINAIVAPMISFATGQKIEALMGKANIYRFVYVIVTKITFFYATRLILKLKNKDDFKLNLIEWVAILSIPIISIATIVFILQISVNTQNYLFILLAIMGVVVTNIITYYLFIKIHRSNSDKLKYAILTEQYALQEKHMDEVKELYVELKTIRHDMKNYMACTIGLLNEGKNDAAYGYLKELLSDKIDAIKEIVTTGNDIVDCIVNTKISICKKYGIDIKCNIATMESSTMDMDLSVLLGNLFDNAIEACKENQHKKRIVFEMKNKKSYLSIFIKNSIDKSILKTNPKLQTSKKDKRNHGLGIVSIKSIVKKYDGMLEHFEEGDAFCCNILLKNEKIC